MASTNFVDGSTVIVAEWMNDLNRLHYTIFADAANVAAARTALGLGTGDSPTFTALTVTATLVSTGTTANIFNITATTVNAFGAATNINMGNAAGTHVFNGQFGFPTGFVDTRSFGLLLATASPASGAGGTAGTILWDASYIYICTASGAWKRVAITGGY